MKNKIKIINVLKSYFVTNLQFSRLYNPAPRQKKLTLAYVVLLRFARLTRRYQKIMSRLGGQNKRENKEKRKEKQNRKAINV